MNPQLDILSIVSFRLSAFLSIYVVVSQSLPACLPGGSLLFPTDWTFSAANRAQPLKKTNINLLLPFLRMSLGASFHKSNNVMCTTATSLPPRHSYISLIPLVPAKQSTTISSYHSTLKQTLQQGISKPNQTRTESHLQLSKTYNFQTNTHSSLLSSHRHNFFLKYWCAQTKYDHLAKFNHN